MIDMSKWILKMQSLGLNGLESFNSKAAKTSSFWPIFGPEQTYIKELPDGNILTIWLWITLGLFILNILVRLIRLVPIYGGPYGSRVVEKEELIYQTLPFP